LWALKPLSNLRRPVPLPFLTAFLMVVLDEGRGVNEYARAVGIHRAAMSRNLHAIGDRARNGGPGLGLVSLRVNPSAPSRSQVFLTPKGRSIATEIFRQLRKIDYRGRTSADEMAR
jgi:DNA-binding MarR family transcriptional regulator